MKKIWLQITETSLLLHDLLPVNENNIKMVHNL